MDDVQERGYANGEIDASKILEDIENSRPVEYNQYIITGSLDIRNLNLTKDQERFVINSLIKITQCKINEEAFLCNATFKGHVEFRNTYFVKNATFLGSQFNEGGDFLESKFKGDVCFKGSEFKKDAYFTNSEFDENANFSGSEFAEFVVADFGKAKFKGDAYFEDIQFRGDAYFKNTQFLKTAYFKRSQFGGNLVDFSGSKFDESAWFTETQFRILSNATFDNIRFKDDALFDNANFDGKISFKRTKYERLYIKWRDIHEFIYDDTSYLLLIENFKKIGFFEDADNCYYYYRCERNKKILKGFHKLIDNGIKTFYGYGVKPYCPLKWSLVFIAVFWFFYLVSPSLTPYFHSIFINIPCLQNLTESSYFLVMPLNTSLTVFLSGAKLAETSQQTLTVSYWTLTFEKLLGSLFLFLFLVSFGKTIVR